MYGSYTKKEIKVYFYFFKIGFKLIGFKFNIKRMKRD